MRRARRMLLTLLAFALPTAALANSVDFDTGTFISGTITGTSNTSIIVTEVGNLATIIIDTGTLTLLPAIDCTTSSTWYNFNGGNVTVDEGDSMVFADSLEGGLTMKGSRIVAISAALLPKAGAEEGTAVINPRF